MSDIDAAQTLHHPTDAVAMRRGCQKVQVVGHQDKRVDRNFICLSIVLQLIEKELPIIGVKENILPVVPALNNMLRHPRQL